MDHLNVLTFDTPDQAFRLRDALLGLQGESLFELSNIMVVTRDDLGRPHIDSSVRSVPGCASAGSVVGLILGAILTVPWVGSAVGTGVGAAMGAVADFGLERRFVKELGHTLTPGKSAVVLLGSQGRLDELGKRLGPLLRGCCLLQTTVDLEREAEIRRLLERQQTGSPSESKTSPSHE